MKRYVPLFLALTLILGCQQKETPPPGAPKRPLRILYLTIWADDLNREFHALCTAWGSKNGVPVIVDDVPLADLSARLATYVAAGQGPDLAVFPAHLTIVNEKKLADVTPIVEAIAKENGEVYPVSRAMNTVDGRWTGVPLYAWSHIWVYRDDLLRAANAQPAQTWSEAAALAQRLTTKQPQIWGLGIGLGRDDDAAMFFQALLWAQGGSVFDKDGRTVRIDSAATRTAVNLLLHLYRSGAIPPGALGWDGASNNKAFLAKTIAITANSPTIYYAAKRQDPALAANITHTIYPAGPAGRFSYATEFSLAYLRTSQRSADITSLLRFIFQRANYERLISAGEGSVNPLYRGIDAMKLWKNDPKLLPGLQSLQIERPVGWPGPVTPAAAEIFEQRVLTDMFARIINDKWTVDAAVREADQRAKAIVQRHAEQRAQ
jgi:multiple sugar transport system substrate-binding protein